MFNSGILDTVIGVIVIFLQLSLVCTAVNELFALMLKKRAKELEKGIGKLLTNPQLVDKFFAHPLIKGLRPDERKPSYIPSRTFALALMDIVRRHSFDGTVTAATQAVADKARAEAAAQAAADTAGTALTQAQKVKQAADAAVTAAGAVDVLTATKAAQDAGNQEAAAQALKTDADAKLTAATAARTEAETFLTQVTTDANDAKLAETKALAAEQAAKEKPKDTALQGAATAARKLADEAADKLAPSASSLLTEARDKVAGVQSDVVPPELKTALLALMDNAGTNLNKAQANLEQWFDDAMDRVSGVYKRKSQVFVVIVAVLVTLLSNVDTLQVADSLSHDKAVRDSLVAAAPEFVKKAEPTPAPTPARSPDGQDGAKETAAPTPTEPSIGSIKASLDELNKLGLPIGYVRVCTPVEETDLDNCALSTQALALVSESEAKVTKAKADLEKAQVVSQKAADDHKSAVDKDTQASDKDTKAALSKAEKDLEEAQANLKRAQTASASAEAESSKAQAAREKVLAARAAKVREAGVDLSAAETQAKASPDDEAKQKALQDARRKVAITDCPICRKASDLTPAQLKQRLPTTHDYQLLSKDFFPAIGALIGDSWNLLYAHWLGWLITALAISLGAPFWFDTLNRVMVIRSTVKPHEKSREQESKDNPDEPDQKKKT